MYVLPDIFQSFWCSYFKTPLMKSFVPEYIKVLGCRLKFCVLIKKWLHQRKFLEIFEDEVVSMKKSLMDFHSDSNAQYF